MGPGKVDPHQKPAAAPGSLGGSIRVSADLGRRRAAGRADPRLRGSAALTLSKYLRPETALPASIGLIVREAQWRILPNVLRRRTSADSAGRSSRLMPAVAVATGGTYGLSVWIDQIINGPPGPPAER